MNKTNNGNQSPVLHLITGLGVGGAERIVIELAVRLTKQQCPVIVVALNNDNGILIQYPEITFPIHQLGIRKKNPFSILRALFTLALLIYRNKVKIIHAHMFHSLLVGLICRLVQPSSKLVFTSHSFAGFSPWRQWLIKKTKALRAVDIIFIEGQHSAMNAPDTRVIPNGVSVYKSQPIRNPFLTKKCRFLFVGRLENPKNPLALIDAFAAKQRKNCELWLAGDGALRKEIEERVANLGISARVRMLGIQNDITSLLREADCFVMSSKWEGLPMALLEAGAMAMPVVAPPVGAIPAILDNDCGYLTEVEDLAKVLDAVEEDYSTAQRRGVRLRERIKNNYSIEHTARKHRSLYLDLTYINRG